MEKFEFRSQDGYSLIGVTLFIVVLGMFAAGGISLKQKYDWAQRQDVTAENMALVKQSLANYQSQNGRLPCAASLSDPLDNPAFGREADCAGAVVAGTFRDAGRGGRTIRYGAVPVRTLGLPDTAIVDGWGHRLVYAVTEYYAGPAEMIDPHGDNGAISIIDANGANATSTPGNIIYTVVSPGADQRGAYTLAGTRIDDCVGTNCVDAGGDGTLQLSIFRQYNTSNGIANNDFTATMTYAASEVSHEWFAEDNWGPCNCVANATQTRTTAAVCRVRGSEVPAPGMCPANTMPPTTKSCAAFCWGDVVFPACPAVSCGQPSPGSVTGTVDCLENDTKPVPESLCNPSDKPTNLTRACPGGGSCGGGGGGSSSSGGGGYADMDGDGLGDTYVGDGCSGTACSSGRGGTVSEGGGSGGSDDGRGSTASGSSGSGGTMSVICTHFYRRGRMPRALWRADLEFSRANLFPCTLRGYHFWGIPAVALMRKYPWTEVFFEWIAVNRAEQIGYLVGLRDKPNYLGAAIRVVIEPLCFVIGIFVPEQNWEKVHADMGAASRRKQQPV